MTDAFWSQIPTIAMPDGTGERVAERAAVVLGARPEYFRVSPDPLDGAFQGTVEVAENLGSSLLLTLDVVRDRGAGRGGRGGRAGTRRHLVGVAPQRPDSAVRGWGVGGLMRLDGVWWLEDRLRQQLRPVPFEVPAGVSRIEVRLDYDRSAGAVLDLGCAGPEGFRGWSGGARQEFAVGARCVDAGLPGRGDPARGVARLAGTAPGPAGGRPVLAGDHVLATSRWPRTLEYHSVRAAGAAAGARAAGRRRPALVSPATCTRTPSTATAR